MRRGDLRRLVEITGLEEEQGGDRPCSPRFDGSDDPGLKRIGREDSGFERVTRRILLAGPGRDGRLTSCLVGFSERVGTLTKDDDKWIHSRMS